MYITLLESSTLFVLNQRPISALKTQGQPAQASMKSVQGWLQPPGAGWPEAISSIVAKIEMANNYVFVWKFEKCLKKA